MFLTAGKNLHSFLFLSSIFLSFTAEGDTLWLENGDVLTGDILRLEEGKLSLKTLYAGTVIIDWKYVRALDSENEFWVTLVGEANPSERMLEGQATGVQVVDGDGTTRSFSAVWPVAAIHRQPPVMADSWQIRGDLGAGLDGQFGNDEERSISLEGELNIDDQWNKNTLKWDLETEREGDKKTSEWLFGYAYSRYLDEHVYVQGAGARDFDSNTDLRYRSSAGGSLGYRLWETKSRELRFSTGLSRLWERYANNGQQKDFALTWMMNYRSELKDQLHYFANTKVFYRLGSGEKLVTLKQGVKWKITSELSLNLNHNLDYDSQPLKNVRKTDNQVEMGLGYQW